MSRRSAPLTGDTHEIPLSPSIAGEHPVDGRMRAIYILSAPGLTNGVMLAGYDPIRDLVAAALGATGLGHQQEPSSRRFALIVPPRVLAGWLATYYEPGGEAYAAIMTIEEWLRFAAEQVGVAVTPATNATRGG